LGLSFVAFLKDFEREHFVGEVRCNPRKVPIHNLKKKFIQGINPSTFCGKSSMTFCGKEKTKI
jgi:hypothetical protein